MEASGTEFDLWRRTVTLMLAGSYFKASLKLLIERINDMGNESAKITTDRDEAE